MHTRTEKHKTAQARSESQPMGGTSQFVDRRPEAVVHGRLGELAAASFQTGQLKALQARADANASARVAGVFQRQEGTGDEEPLQGKFGTVQREEDDDVAQGKWESVQRSVDEEEPVQGRFAAVQRQESEDEDVAQGKWAAAQLATDEDETVQGRFGVAQRQAEATPKANRTGLPDNLKSGIESLSGISMDNVKVHYNSSQPAQLNALAYAQGTDIHVAPGQEQHLPHEAWHVVQQAQGRVRPTMQMKEGIPVNDDRGLEHEADVMGAKAVQMMRSPSGKPASATILGGPVGAVSQLKDYSSDAAKINSTVRGDWSIQPGNRIDGLKASMGKSYGGKWALDYIVKMNNIPYVGNDGDIGKRASIAKAAKAGNCDDYGDLAYSLFKQLGNSANVAIEQQPGHTYGVAWDDGDGFDEQTIIDPWVSRAHLRKDEAYYRKPDAAKKIKTGKSDGTKLDTWFGSKEYIMALYDKNFNDGKAQAEATGKHILDEHNKGNKTEGIY